MNKVFRWLGVTSFALVLSSPAMASSLKVKGLDGKVEDNVDAYLSAISKDDYSATLRFKEQVLNEISQALQALGYYQPKYDYQVTGSGSKTKIVVTVEQGPRTHISKSNLNITGDAKDDPAFMSLVKDSGLGIGEPLNQGKYEAFKSSLTSLAVRRGYFDAELTKSTLEIVPSRNEAFVTIDFNSGRRYTFGETTFQGSQIDDNRLRSMIPYTEDEPYLASKLGEYNERLSNVGWFSSIFVGGDVKERKDDAIPIHVVVTPQVRNQFETGIGYSTDLGPRLKFNWKKPWITSKGHSFYLKSEISQVEPKVEAAYKIPLDDVLNNYYQIVGGIRYVDSHDTLSTQFGVGVERHWRLDSGWNRTVSLRWMTEDYKQGGDEEGVFNVLMPGISYSKSDMVGGMFPSKGSKYNFSVDFADKSLGSNTSFVRLQAKSAWIRSFGENQRGIFRLDGGAVLADDVTDVPPSLRYFIGGDNSVRGYGYQSISPRNSKGRMVGGQYMATSSIEYQYRVYGDWWGAVFYDYGSAWNDSPDWKRGTGVGVRWVSPVGPIRLDFAWGLDKKEKDKFQLHFTLGPEL
ncbi:autotransporter assembly complex protein TamA [Photobacterium leiognathi]|uniref:autotransporter assembly complex protein TamA n=1 Tax=Photobacterium leiognathi TaxID=553611 RepID=UPI0027363A63|nr:autotransporter assembly complex family protein [Photobacterium leiognathi]